MTSRTSKTQTTRMKPIRAVGRRRRQAYPLAEWFNVLLVLRHLSTWNMIMLSNLQYLISEAATANAESSFSNSSRFSSTTGGAKYDPEVDLTGKTYIVTGATSGIGKVAVSSQNA